MRTETAHLSDGSTLVYYPERKLGEGTEKVFFQSKDERLVVGLYKESAGKSDPERMARLDKIVNQYNPTLDSELGPFWEAHYCWPKGIVVSPSIGVISPRFPRRYRFSDQKGDKKGKWFVNPAHLNRLPEAERGTLWSRIQLGRHLSRALSRMHASGLAHSDLSGNNILMDLTSGSCLLIDIDSLVVQGIHPPAVLGTRGYIAPEVVATSHLPLKHPKKNLPNINTDLHSLAVILYELLLFRHPLEGIQVHSPDPEADELFMFGEKALFIEDPKDLANRTPDISVTYDSLGPYLAPLFLQAFTQGLKAPELRPTANEWDEALTRTLDILYPERNNQCMYQWVVCRTGAAVACPSCGWEPSGPFPVMHLFRRIGRGRFISEKRYLAIWDQKKIYPWHCRTDRSCPAEVPKECPAAGYFEQKGAQWFFVNTSADCLRSSNGERVAPGRSLPLYSHQMVLMSKGGKGRLGVFDFLNEPK